jgi:hypothetical protein
MSVDKILQEASAVLTAAIRHSNELSEVGKIEHELYRMRILITTVAAHSYSSLGNNENITEEMTELQKVKDVILRTAEERFGVSNQILNEFRYSPKQKTGT